MFILWFILALSFFYIAFRLTNKVRHYKKEKAIKSCNKVAEIENLTYETYRERINSKKYQFNENSYIHFEKDYCFFDGYNHFFKLFYLKMVKVEARDKNDGIAIILTHWRPKDYAPEWEKVESEILFREGFYQNAIEVCTILSKMLAVVQKEARDRNIDLTPLQPPREALKGNINAGTNKTLSLKGRHSEKIKNLLNNNTEFNKTIYVELQWGEENVEIQRNLASNIGENNRIVVVYDDYEEQSRIDSAKRKVTRSFWYVYDEKRRLLGFLPKSFADLYDANTLERIRGKVVKIYIPKGTIRYRCLVELLVPEKTEWLPDVFTQTTLLEKMVPFNEKVIFLDYSIANSKAELCRLSALIIENGKIVKVVDEMIKPLFDFDDEYLHSNIHGITRAHVLNSENLLNVWKKHFSMNLKDYVFVLNKANEKLQVLIGNLLETTFNADDKTVAQSNSIYYIDVYELIRISMYDIKDYSIQSIEKALNIQLKTKNDSLQNTINNLNIFCALCYTRYIDINYEAQRFNYAKSFYLNAQSVSYTSCYANRKFDLEQINFSEDLDDLSDKVIVLTGEFKRFIDRQEMAFYRNIKVKRVAKKITKSVDVLIVGENFNRALVQKAHDLGHVKIIKEDLFYALIDKQVNEKKLEKERIKAVAKDEINMLPSFHIVKQEKSRKEKCFCEEEFPYFDFGNPTNFVVTHIATTGLEDDDEIVELCAIKYIKGIAVEKFETLIKPTRKNANDAQIYNGINNEMVKNAPFLLEVAESFIKFVGNDPIVGFNTRFLYKYLCLAGLMNLFEGREVYDVLSEIKTLHKYTLESKTLKAVCDFYNVYFENTTIVKCYSIGKLQSLLNKSDQ